MENTIKATRGEGKNAETREFEAAHWALIGSNELTNGGWSVAEPAEAKGSKAKKAPAEEPESGE